MANPYRPPPADWARIDTIFTQALDLDPERWPAFLEEACGEDVEVRSRVADLLRRSQTVHDFLEESCLEVQPELAGELAHSLESRDAPFPTEARIGPYRIVDTLGRGGAGTVYLAERAEGEERPPVALKVLRRGLDTDDLLERFTVERQILATLDHPDVARLLDAGATEDGRPYLVMEHVDGEPITEHCGARNLSVQERLGLFVRVARAVHHAHGSLIVHRDLKPTNVLVAEDGAPKLLDFGIAKLLDPDALAGKGPQTRTGTRLLTPGYASPEQRRGEPVTPASDIYQLGFLLYELLTGVAAYEAAGRERKEAGEGPLHRIPAPSRVMRRTGHTVSGKETVGDTDPAREAPPDTGSTTQRRRRRDLDRIVMTALEEEPEDRYPTAAALAADVERVLQGQRPQGVGHLPMGLLVRKLARRLGTRHRKVAVAAMALGLMAGILAVASATLRGSPDGQPPAADPGDPMFDLVPPPWVVVADFDAPAEEPELGWAIREIVMEALDMTGGVAPLPPSELEAALRMASLPDTIRMDRTLARQLAVRAGFPVALTGSVFRLGSGYAIRANALDPEDGHVLVSVLERSTDQDGLMTAVERLANHLASELAESMGTARQVRSATLVTTSSFQAYEEYLRYLQAHREGRPVPEREAALRRVLALDPEFAMAWRAMALSHNQMSRPDSARAALARALALWGQVTDLERLHIEVAEAIIEGFRDEIRERRTRQVLSVNPLDQEALRSLIALLERQWRYEEALQYYDVLVGLFPSLEIARGSYGRFNALMFLGRFDEARTLQSGLPEHGWREGEVLMALGEGEWAVAESLALAIQHDVGGLRNRVAGWRWAEASALVARGAVRAADSTLWTFPSWDHGRARLVLALATGCDLAAGRALPTPDDSTAYPLRWNAAIARAVGPQGPATDWLITAERRAEDYSNTTLLTLDTVLVEAMHGHWSDVPRPPRPARARQGLTRTYEITPLRWLVADGYERSGQADSAAVYFHMVVDSALVFRRDLLLRGFAYPFAHRRLAFLYARLGDRGRAEHHWRTFRESFTDPDPELRWLLDESPMQRRLLSRRAGDHSIADENLFSGADRACASIEAGRIASFERALKFTAAWFEAHLAEHGQYPSDGFPGLPDDLGRDGQLLILTEGDEAGWTATAIDLRDTRTCRLRGGESATAMEGEDPSQMVCVQRTPADAYREDLATLAVRGALSHLAGELNTAWETHNPFPPELTVPDGQRRRLRPGESFTAQQYPEVRIEILQADSRELRAVGTRTDSPARCTLRVTSSLQVFLGC